MIISRTTTLMKTKQKFKCVVDIINELLVKTWILCIVHGVKKEKKSKANTRSVS
jgi:hypothetical protein